MSASNIEVLDEIYEIIMSRKREPVQHSYVCSLLNHGKGTDKILEKLGEETVETIIAAKNGIREDIIYESCDLIFHLMVMLAAYDIELKEITEELSSRKK
ncbi:phosphoribosyl-ATP diphosphatase [Methanosalsum zhilinae DSM 4017]|uniref:Phosphoribosyl-ATP pyrophosphatase n=1 Tax=Methanosalsum zhilinae (strain DSM 4017 / NBRC 107636 / OCM 62 / WeN5) TaxID=679901 RepID=F7XKH7_METZD|nr:phosphoribosyl-ATP diphosphatase [Methanosalsum zhilinae]AEH61751.1 phosphoribosyl-ATP diphosphatase [Methanosalsum zhilinae DSM 4017]